MPSTWKFVLILWLGGASMSQPLWADTPAVPQVPPLPLVPPAPPLSDLPPAEDLASALTAQVPEDTPVPLAQVPEWLQKMLERIVREHVPAKYVHDKDWGHQKRRWNGVRVRRDGLRISTKRKWKEVNHGTWKRYEIQQIDPTRHLTLRLTNVHDAGDGKVGLDIHLTSKFAAHGRLSRWSRGVQLMSVSVDADADVALSLSCELGMQLDATRFPPDIRLRPRVTDAHLELREFKLKRISKLDGPVVKQLGRNVHDLLRDMLDKKRDRLPEKINQQLAKHEDKLRLSVADFAAKKWDQLTQPVAQE